MNELPLTFFEILVVVQLILIFYTIFTLKGDIPHLILTPLGAFLGYMNANMILNGNVVIIAATTTATTYIPVQSLPVHYILLALAAIMALLSGYVVIDFFRVLLESKEEGFSMEGFK